MASRELRVNIIGDASSLNKAFGSASTATERFGAKMKTVGKNMTIAGAAITGVAVVIGKRLVDSALAAEVSQAKLATAFKNAGLSAAKYGAAIDKAKDAGRALGFANVETSDSLGKLVQGGDSVKQAMTDLALAQDYARATGRDLASATGSIVKVHQGLLRPLKELGISLPQVSTNMKALTEAHKESKTAITANEKALAFQQDKLATGAQAVQLMTDKLHGQAAAFAETSAGGLAVFNAQMDDLQESLGTLLLPFIDRVVAALNRLLDMLSKLSPRTQKLIVDIGLGVAAFGAVLLVLGPVVAAVGSLLPIFAALASPIGLVVVAIGALVLALTAAVLWPDKLQAALQRMGLSAEDSKEIVDDLRNSFIAIRAVVEAVMPAILAVVRPALEVIKGLLMIVSGILRGDFSEAWKGIKIVVANELKFVLALLTAFPRVVLGVAVKIGEAILDGVIAGVQALPGKVRDVVVAAIDVVKNLGPAIFVAAVGLGQKFIAGLRSGLVGVAGAVGDAVAVAVRAAVNYIIDQINAALEFTISGPGPLPDIHVDAPNIPHLASGARNFRGGLALVGERGPELVNIPRGSSVTPNAALGGGGSLMAEITMPVYLDSTQIAEVIRREYLRFEKRNGRAAV